jgi:hypothetical protein
MDITTRINVRKTKIDTVSVPSCTCSADRFGVAVGGRSVGGSSAITTVMVGEGVGEGVWDGVSDGAGEGVAVDVDVGVVVAAAVAVADAVVVAVGDAV